MVAAFVSGSQQGESMSGVKGELCESADSLNLTAKAKKRDYVERRADTREKIEEPWRTHRGRTLRRAKPPDEIFEDRLWLLLFRLGFVSLNKDRRCLLEYKAYTKQIDVLGRDEQHAFVLQCHTTETEDKAITARGMLEEFAAHHDEIRKALEEHWGHGSFTRVCHIVALGSRDKRDVDADYVRQNPQHNLYLWSLNDIEYMEQLAASIGPISKQQLYAIMFAGKRNSKLERTRPAIKARMGDRVVYNFLIRAKELVDYVYVHHRKLTSISEASQAYQRMLRPQKLKQIRDYIDTDDGFFANNIILNFVRPLEWTRIKGWESTVETGTVRLPGYYGCAWIIDGQHRLYGAAAASKDVLLPVIALQQVTDTEQASLFVEINKKQTAVAGNLLWDLYTDIYRGSDEPREARLWLISDIARRLGISGPLRQRIEFESDLSTHEAPLTLTAVCTAIQQNCPWEILTSAGSSEETAKQVARTVNCFFDAVRELRPAEWEDPNANRLVFTNNGFVVFMMLFGDSIRHVSYKGRKALLAPASGTRLTAEIRRLLEPAMQYVSEEPAVAQSIVRRSGHAGHMASALDIVKWINDFCPDFCPARLNDGLVDMAEKVPLPGGSIIRERAAKFEEALRRFVLEKLIEWYGKIWWKHGLPGNMKSELDTRWQKAAANSPELRSSQEPNKLKFNYCSLGQVADVILFGENWDNGRFEAIFPCDKNDVKRRIFEVTPVRDAKAHERGDTPQELLEAASSLRWFSMLLGQTSLNPYVDASNPQDVE